MHNEYDANNTLARNVGRYAYRPTIERKQVVNVPIIILAGIVATIVVMMSLRWAGIA